MLIRISNGYTVSSENVEEGLYRNTEEQIIDEPEKLRIRKNTTVHFIQSHRHSNETHREEKDRSDEITISKHINRLSITNSSTEMEV